MLLTHVLGLWKAKTQNVELQVGITWQWQQASGSLVSCLIYGRSTGAYYAYYAYYVFVCIFYGLNR